MALMFRMVDLIVVATGMLAMVQFAALTQAKAEEIIPRHVEYSNDFISDQGKAVACVVTLVVVSAPDPRTLNFQLLALEDRAGWKITGGKMDWKMQKLTPLRAEDGSFSGRSFIMPTAFEKSLTPEGQLLGVISQQAFIAPFIQAFFEGRYTVAVTWQGMPGELTYYIADPPSANVKAKFYDCIKRL